ncbi:serine hydrolase [Pedobacter gandavensis]|uniref:Serine hydrolase n=1 Tax=Pedobacter gandavensis TaxID=2679963 RepID=A0ABR6ES56_9SPHI|nr:serine hydrolase [Pedobacter gandavensis]MBB2148095.1 serine hydrolase [Pedobacter gandavensis]
MKYTFTLCFLAAINFTGIAQEHQKPTDVRLQGMDSLLNKILKDQNVAGFSVAIVDGDQVLYSKGFGYRDLKNKKPVTSNTLFAIGSSTKAFTSGLLGMLQKEGKLSLDGNAVSYLPQLRFSNDNLNNQVTVRDLMTHRTGLSRYDLSWYIFNTSNRDSIINRVRYMEPNAGLREKWQYNNYMFLAQGMIAEKLTGKSWEQNIKERFFLPLDMNRSTTSIVEFEKDADASLPYKTEGNEIKKIDYYNIDGMGPAGSINSSANDMANWLKLWISKGNFKGKELLPPAYITEASSVQMARGGGLPDENPDIYMNGYGLGWMISSYRGHYQVEHGGNIDGFSASVSFFPSDKLGVVVLTNQNGSEVPEIVLNSIADRFFKLKTIDWNGKAIQARENSKKKEALAKKSAVVKEILNTKPSRPLKEYTGLFANPGYGQMDVTVKNDSLFAQMGKYSFWLKHNYYDVFNLRQIEDGKTDTSKSNINLNFIGDLDGKISSLSSSLEPGMKPTIFTATPRLVNLDLKTLEQYVGTYMLGTVKTTVSIKGNTLYVYVPGQPEYETLALGDHTFKLKALNGFSVKFDVKDRKKAESMLFIQPNGSFKAMRKDN